MYCYYNVLPEAIFLFTDKESARLYAVGPAGSRWQLNYLAKASNSPLARSIACACNFAVKNIWSLFNYAM